MPQRGMSDKKASDAMWNAAEEAARKLEAQKAPQTTTSSNDDDEDDEEKPTVAQRAAEVAKQAAESVARHRADAVKASETATHKAADKGDSKRQSVVEYLTREEKALAPPEWVKNPPPRIDWSAEVDTELVDYGEGSDDDVPMDVEEGEIRTRTRSQTTPAATSPTPSQMGLDPNFNPEEWESEPSIATSMDDDPRQDAGRKRQRRSETTSSPPQRGRGHGMFPTAADLPQQWHPTLDGFHDLGTETLSSMLERFVRWRSSRGKPIAGAHPTSLDASWLSFRTSFNAGRDEDQTALNEGRKSRFGVGPMLQRIHNGCESMQLQCLVQLMAGRCAYCSTSLVSNMTTNEWHIEFNEVEPADVPVTFRQDMTRYLQQVAGLNAAETHSRQRYPARQRAAQTSAPTYRTMVGSQAIGRDSSVRLSAPHVRGELPQSSASRPANQAVAVEGHAEGSPSLLWEANYRLQQSVDRLQAENREVRSQLETVRSQMERTTAELSAQLHQLQEHVNQNVKRVRLVRGMVQFHHPPPRTGGDTA
jgi:hypothetical protein